MEMKYITNTRMPTEKAHGYQICKMCEEFSNAGVDVELIVPTRKNKIYKSIFEYYSINNNFKIRYIKVFDFLRFEKFFLNKAFYLNTIFFLIRLVFIKIKKEDLIYTRDDKLLPLFMFFKRRVIWECHSLPKKSNKYSNIFKSCYRFIVLTNELKNMLIDSGVDCKKILVSPSAVDISKFDINIKKDDARKELKLPIDKIILGYTGNFKTNGMDKGINDILKAIKILNNKNFLFVAVGGSSEDINFYKKISQDIGVDDQVIFLERVDLSKLAVYQKSFDILLMPFPFNKHYAYFMSPLKMFEYMSSGRPIIASNLPSICEILDEKACLFCNSDDPFDLANKIINLSGNELLAENLSKEAYKKVFDYNWENRAKKIIQFIKN